MSHDDSKQRKEQKPIWLENFITCLQAQGFVRWGSCSWIKPQDIPLFIAKGKIKRSRKRRAPLMAQRAEARMQKAS